MLHATFYDTTYNMYKKCFNVLLGNDRVFTNL